MKYAAIAAIASAMAVLGAPPAGAPGEWRPVHTNDIARWMAERGTKDGVAVDRAARTVTFLAEATGVSEVDPVEFFAIGPLSDRAYESFAVSVASPAAIAAGLDAIGVPRGLTVDPRRSRFWPQGDGVSFSARILGEGKELSLGDLISDERAADEGAILERPLVATGGSRDSSGAVDAVTNMPCAVFALYSHAPSLLQLDGAFDQSGVYGRFRAKRRHKAGDLFEFTIKPGGGQARLPSKAEERTVRIAKGADLAPILADLRKRAEAARLYACLEFAPDVPLSDAVNAARAFELVDGAGVRMNGAAPGQFFYRAFLPDQAWRKREGRIFQPFEVHVSDGARKFVHVEEDYSGAGIDPVLKPHETPFAAWSDLPQLVAKTAAAKVDVLFLFAPSGTPVGELTPILAPLASRIATFYIFAEP